MSRDGYDKRFYWYYPPIGEIKQKNVKGLVLEFYDNLGINGNFGKIKVVDVCPFRNQELLFFKEEIEDGLKIPLGNHADRYKINERYNVLVDVVWGKELHPYFETNLWAVNIRKYKEEK